MAQTVKVLNSVAALGADATVSGGILQVAGVSIPIRNIRPSSAIQVYVAEQLQITTVTPTAADSTVYSITVQGRSTIDQSNKTWTATVTSAVGATATTISDQFRTKFNAFADIPCTFSGTATFIITGITGSPKFTASASAANVGTLAFDATQAAIIGYGDGALLSVMKAPMPISTDTQIVATNDYTTVTINYLSTPAVETRNSFSTNYDSLILYVNQGDADYPTLTGTYGVITQALKGVAATHITATGTLAVTQATGAVELASSGTWMVDAAIQPGDIAYVASTFVYYPIISMSDTNSGLTNNLTPGDLAAAAFKWVTLREAV